MAVAVDDHSELRAPVANVVVADDMVSGKSQCLTDRIADHRAAKVPDVHGFCHVRSRKIHNDVSRQGYGLNSPVGRHLRSQKSVWR